MVIVAKYVTLTCGTCGERVTTHKKQARYDHVAAVHRARKYDHEVTTVNSTVTDEAA